MEKKIQKEIPLPSMLTFSYSTGFTCEEILDPVHTNFLLGGFIQPLSQLLILESVHFCYRDKMRSQGTISLYIKA